MKAYMEGLDMGGIKEIREPRPEVYLAIPKHLKFTLTEGDLPINPSYLRATYKYQGMIPYYKLTDIS